MQRVVLNLYTRSAIVLQVTEVRIKQFHYNILFSVKLFMCLSTSIHITVLDFYADRQTGKANLVSAPQGGEQG